MVHGGDEILWTVPGVGQETNGSEVAKVILKNLEAVWGVGSLVGAGSRTRCLLMS